MEALMQIHLGPPPPVHNPYRTVLPRPSKRSPEEKSRTKVALKKIRETRDPDLIRAYVEEFMPKFLQVLDADPGWITKLIMADEVSYYIGGILVGVDKEENQDKLEELYAKLRNHEGSQFDLLNECLTLCSMAPLERGDTEYQEYLLRGLFYVPPKPL
jgi:hypothetical protein